MFCWVPGSTLRTEIHLWRGQAPRTEDERQNANLSHWDGTSSLLVNKIKNKDTSHHVFGAQNQKQSGSLSHWN